MNLIQLTKLTRLIHALYPPTCALCYAHSSSHWDLCANCYADLPHNQVYCLHCASPLLNQDNEYNICENCQRDPPLFERCITPLRYADTAAFLIKGLKFHGQLAYGRILGDILAARLAEESNLLPTNFHPAIAPRPEWIIPVPLPPTRLRERGFNQAHAIAQATAKMLHLPIKLNCCIRFEYPQSQKSLTREQRILNVRGSFATIGAIPSCVAVVDDVVTTGATLNELTRVLKQAGAQYVYVWAIARTGRLY